MNSYAQALRRRWPIVASVVVVGLVVLAVLGLAEQPTYRAKQVLIFQEAGSPSRDAFVRDLQAAAALAKTPSVAGRVAARLNATNSPADLARRISARANVDANTVEIVTVPYSSAKTAQTLANGYAAELTTALEDQTQNDPASDDQAAEQERTLNQLKGVEQKLAAAAKAPPDQQELLRAQRDALLKHYQDSIVAALALPPSQSLTSEGGATTQRIDHHSLTPTTIPGWMLAAGILAVLGAAIALLVDRLDDRIRSREAAERAFGLPVLADVPSLPAEKDLGGVVTATQPLSKAADAFRDLRSSLARLGRAGRTAPARGNHFDLTAALVTSATRGDGSTSAAVNLAAAVAETGKSVLVIDCDLRSPEAHERLGVVQGAGLSDVLTGVATIDQVAVPTSVPGVRLVSAGQPVENPGALFARQQDFVAPARMLADFVVLDGPPLAVHDAAELLWMVDAVVVSCRTGDTRANEAAGVSERLEVLGAPPSGVVLMGAAEREPDGVDWQPDSGNGQRVEASAAPVPPPAAAAAAATTGRTAPPAPTVPRPSPPFVPSAGAAPAQPASAPAPAPAGAPSSGGSSSLSISVPSPARASVATAPPQAPAVHWGTRVQPGGAVASPAPPIARPAPAPIARPAPVPIARPAPLVKPAPPAEAPAEEAPEQPETAEEEAAPDSDTIRRQLALPTRRTAGWAGTIALMIFLWVVIRAFLFQSFYIPSPSMSPALKPGDRVLVSKLSYRLHDVHRGDIVVFKRPPHVQAGPEVKDLVKRVIGLPGDTVEARNGQILVNGQALKESYVPKGATTSNLSPTRVPANKYWVMGDNRTVSEDSRYFGSISEKLIVGRVFFQIWPVGSLGLV